MVGYGYLISAPHFGEFGHSLVVFAFLGFRHFDGADFIGSAIIYSGSERNLYGVVGGSADCFHVGWFWLGVARGDEKNFPHMWNKLNRKMQNY
jgi:hypothetical protein